MTIGRFGALAKIRPSLNYFIADKFAKAMVMCLLVRSVRPDAGLLLQTLCDITDMHIADFNYVLRVLED